MTQLIVELLICMYHIINFPPKACPWVCYKNFHETYTKCPYIFIPLEASKRSWQGWQLGVYTCSHQLIVMIELNYFSISSKNNSFFDCWLVFCIESINIIWSQNLSLGVLEVLCGPYKNRTYIYPPPPHLCAGLGKIMARVTVVWLHFSEPIY